MYEIYINWELVDLGSDFELPLTFQLFDIVTGDASLSDYSKIIKFPLTDNNKRIFGFPDLIESASVVTKSKFNLRALKNGIEIVSNGYCIFESVNNGEIECSAYYRNYNFYKDIENKTLKDLDLSELDHIWVKANIDTFIDNPALSNYVYVLIEWGELIAPYATIEQIENSENPLTRVANYEGMFPIVKASYLINKIITDAGYIGKNFLPSDLPSPYDNMYIPLISILPDQTTEEECQDFRFDSSADQTDWSMMQGIHQIGDYEQGYQALLFEGEVDNFFEQGKVVVLSFEIDGIDKDDYPYTVYRVGCNGKFYFSASVHLTAVMELGQLFELKVAICKHSTSDYFTIDEGNAIDEFEILGEETVTLDINHEDETASVSASADLIPGEYVSVILILVAGWGPTIELDFVVEDDSYFRTTLRPVLTTTGYGYNLTIAKNLPDIKQKDFIKSILGFFGAVITSSMHDKTLTLKYIKDIFKLRNPQDWSNKIDLSEHPQMIHMLEYLAKRNNFSYQDPDDEDFTNDEYLYNGYFEITNGELLEDEKDYIKLPFAPSKMVMRILADLNIPQIKMFNDVFQQIFQPKPRILLVDIYNTSEEISYRTDNPEVMIKIMTGAHDELRAFFQLDEPGYYASLAGGKTLDLQEFIDDNYNELVQLYNRFKMLIHYLELNEKDIGIFDHFLSVWIKKYNSYFYINRINDYTDGLTQVELIKLY